MDPRELLFRAIVFLQDLYSYGGIMAVFCVVLGAYKCLIPLYQLFFLIVIKSCRPSKLKGYRRKDAYAVITGCTDGIGKEFALQLAKKGFNLILLSRTQSKLEALRTEIAQFAQVDTIVRAVDFSNPQYAAVASACEEASGPVSVLVNNVGATHKYPQKFLDTELEDIDYIVKMNIDSTNKMIHTVLPYMLNGKGLVLNLGVH
eukprot:TRINITY_DN7308_c0_g1_i2.p1 TRINITY_DN7308_c0_g1~~TRINITY_DN7308_c0_g1_i2.p1  ORF type:complete len:203 (+),score=44.21 TRINITY_DN7308_c0_g1_i2:242-850(+)